MAKKGKKQKSIAKAGPARKIIVQNRKARHNYQLMDTFEAGLVLLGSEVKSLREGQVNVTDGYIQFRRRRSETVRGSAGGEVGQGTSEAFLTGVNIKPYKNATHVNHEPMRARKLLLHRRELKKLEAKSNEDGLSIVVLSLYFVNGRIKCEVAVGRGKKLYDKRESIKQRDVNRQLNRERSAGN